MKFHAKIRIASCKKTWERKNFIYIYVFFLIDHVDVIDKKEVSKQGK